MNLTSPSSEIIDGSKTRYFEAGHGTPLVFFHGGGITSSAEDWTESFYYFSKYFHVFAFDQLGFGYTEKPESDHSIVQRVKHSIAFLDAMGIEKAHLVGYSQGTHLIVRLALCEVKRARTLILSTGRVNALQATKEESSKILEISELSRNPVPNMDYTRKLYLNLVYQEAKITEDFLARKLEISSAPGNLEAAAARRASTLLEDQQRSQIFSAIRSMPVPAMVVWGRQDRVIPISNILDLFNALPMADLHIFDKCGHFLMFDKPEEYNSIVTEFCKSH